MLSQGRNLARFCMQTGATRERVTRRRLWCGFLDGYVAAVPGVQENPAALQQFHAQQGLIYRLENLNLLWLAVPQHLSFVVFKLFRVATGQNAPMPAFANQSKPVDVRFRQHQPSGEPGVQNDLELLQISPSVQYGDG